jgi:uncharacterized sulfatase
VKTDRYTFVIRRTPKGEEVLLYDNRVDPYQLKNIAEENSELVEKLTARLHEWLDATGDPWER